MTALAPKAEVDLRSCDVAEVANRRHHPIYSITSSASVTGKSMPVAFAFLRLMTSL
jgi:hypothetical protein